jgi:protein-L-isoaspartate(D-aspartate) O-methyltransferase
MSGFATARQRMVDGQVRPSDVTDLRIIDALLAVPREAFVPPDQRAMAYLDIDLEFSPRDPAKRFLIKPAVLAKMLQAAEIGLADTVLVAGGATGYAAAVVAQLAGQVTATEADPAQAAIAAAVLAELGRSNVRFSATSAADGDPSDAPYDVIVLDGATEVTPDRLYRQLKEGGRLVGVFASTKPSRAMLVTHSRGDLGSRGLFDAAVPVVQGFERLPSFVF